MTITFRRRSNSGPNFLCIISEKSLSRFCHAFAIFQCIDVKTLIHHKSLTSKSFTSSFSPSKLLKYKISCRHNFLPCNGSSNYLYPKLPVSWYVPEHPRSPKPCQKPPKTLKKHHKTSKKVQKCQKRTKISKTSKTPQNIFALLTPA